MTLLKIPATSGTYYAPAGTSLAALVSSLPAEIALTDGNWVEATKTLSSQAGGALVASVPLVAGDLIRVTGGTGVRTGTYVVAATTGNGPTSVTLTQSLSILGVDLNTAHDIAADSKGPGEAGATNVTKAGYLLNPLRNALAPRASYLQGLHGQGTFKAATGLSISSIATIIALGAAGDTLDLCDSAGTVLTGGLQFVASSLSRSTIFQSNPGFEYQVRAAYPPCFKTGGTGSGFLVNYRNDYR